jgi:hypothetical protein
MFRGKGMLIGIFRPKMEDVTTDCRKLLNEEIHNL